VTRVRGDPHHRYATEAVAGSSRGDRQSHSVPNLGRTFTIIRVTKLLGTPLAGEATTTTRANDSDRQDTCKILDGAMTDGELSMEEHRQRVSAATNAVILGDLQALVDDLQTAGTALQWPGVMSPKSPKFAA
jgi:hypothetical protein